MAQIIREEEGQKERPEMAKVDSVLKQRYLYENLVKAVALNEP